MALHTCRVKHSDKHCELVQYLPLVLVHKQPAPNKTDIHTVIMMQNIIQHNAYIYSELSKVASLSRILLHTTKNPFMVMTLVNSSGSSDISSRLTGYRLNHLRSIHNRGKIFLSTTRLKTTV